MTYQRLALEQQHKICEFIESLVKLANDEQHPLCEFARTEIGLVLWRWTADAFHERERVVKRGVFKYDVNVHPATREAREKKKRTDNNKGLRHEHVVPRGFIARRIIELRLDAAEIWPLLDRFCKAVIVTDNEDKLLKPKKEMPESWDWTSGDPYARYRRAGLYDSIVFP